MSKKQSYNKIDAALVQAIIDYSQKIYGYKTEIKFVNLNRNEQTNIKKISNWTIFNKKSFIWVEI